MGSRKGNLQSLWVKWGIPHLFFLFFFLLTCVSIPDALWEWVLAWSENSQTAQLLWAGRLLISGTKYWDRYGAVIVLPIIPDFVQSKCFRNANWMNLKRKNSRGEQRKWCITNIHSFRKDLLKFLLCQHLRNSKRDRKFLPLNSLHSMWSKRSAYIWFIFS